MGADVTETDDGMIIDGGRPLHGASISAHKDHRLAMTFAIAALAAEGSTELQDADCVSISYPDFYTDLKRAGPQLNTAPSPFFSFPSGGTGIS